MSGAVGIVSQLGYADPNESIDKLLLQVKEQCKPLGLGAGACFISLKQVFLNIFWPRPE